MNIAEKLNILIMRYRRTRRSGKYNAVKTIVDGITFGSKKEARRYGVLKLLLRAKKISNLEVHPEFPLYASNPETGLLERVGKYVGDFSYFDNEIKDVVVEDVKSKATMTTIYRFKKKMMKANYGIEIKEIF